MKCSALPIHMAVQAPTPASGGTGTSGRPPHVPRIDVGQLRDGKRGSKFKKGSGTGKGSSQSYHQDLRTGDLASIDFAPSAGAGLTNNLFAAAGRHGLVASLTRVSIVPDSAPAPVSRRRPKGIRPGTNRGGNGAPRWPEFILVSQSVEQ